MDEGESSYLAFTLNHPKEGVVRVMWVAFMLNISVLVGFAPWQGHCPWTLDQLGAPPADSRDCSRNVQYLIFILVLSLEWITLRVWRLIYRLCMINYENNDKPGIRRLPAAGCWCSMRTLWLGREAMDAGFRLTWPMMVKARFSFAVFNRQMQGLIDAPDQTTTASPLTKLYSKLAVSYRFWRYACLAV